MGEAFDALCPFHYDMKFHQPIRFLLVLAATSSFLTAQTPAAGLAKEASAVEPAIELHVNVSGLTQDNLPKVKESLSALTYDVYACEPCKFEQATAGKCAKCSGALAAKKKPLFSKATPSVAENVINLTLQQGRPTRLSEIEGALMKNSIKLDYDKFLLSGKETLVVKGGAADQVAPIEKAITDAKLFEEVKGNFDPASGEIHLMVRSGAKAPSKMKVTEAFTTAGLKVQLSDVIYGKLPTRA